MQIVHLFDIKEQPLFSFLSFLPKTADGQFAARCRSPGCTTEGDRDRNQHMHLPSKAHAEKKDGSNEYS